MVNAMQHYAILCCVVLCYIVLCYIVLCYATLCYVMLYDTYLEPFFVLRMSKQVNNCIG